MIKHVLHHSRSPLKRGAFSLFIVSLVMTLGTVGLHMIEGEHHFHKSDKP